MSWALNQEARTQVSMSVKIEIKKIEKINDMMMIIEKYKNEIMILSNEMIYIIEMM